MRKNRLAKKPLIVLSSLLGGASVVSLTGLALKEAQRYDQAATQFSNTSLAQSATSFPNYGLTERAMFPYNPENLNNYHAGSIVRGQSVTPYGWLGVYDSTNVNDPKKTKMALTAWNGEILWTTDVVNNQTYESIIDIKYDFQTNLVAVLSSNKLETGVFDLNRNNNSTTATKIQFYSALTGVRVPWEIKVDSNFADRAVSAMTSSNNEGSLLDPKSFTKDTFNSAENWRAKDLYGIEFVGANSSAGTSLSYRYALVNLQPDMTRFYHQTSGKAPTLKQILYKFKDLVKVHILDQRVGSGAVKTKDINIDLGTLLKAKGGKFNSWIDIRNGHETIEYIQNNNQDFVNLNNAFLLTNPFWTATAEPDHNIFFLHILFGSGDQSRTFHLSMAFDRYGTYIGSNAERLDQGELKLNVDSNWFNNFNRLSRKAVFDYPANTRPNHNIFTPDLVTISYPYARSPYSLTTDFAGAASSYNVPIYNVAQLKFHPDTGLVVPTKINSKLDSKIFPIGQEIFANLSENSFPSSLNNMIHKYNRLLSVNSFDQSFTYAASPNFKTGINPNEPTRSFASFWFVKSNSTYTNAYNAFPFILERSQTDPLTTTLEKILQEGFTFDYRIEPNITNLYFNAARTAADYHGSPLGKANKIMILKQFRTDKISGFGDQITKLDHHTKPIEANNYGALIHTRIKLENWFNRNPFIFTNPPTMWQNKMSLVEANDNSVTIDKNWKLRTSGNQLIDDAFYKRAFAVVSHNSNTTSTSQLAFKNPRLFVNDNGQGDRIDIRSELAPIGSQLNYYTAWFPTIFPNTNRAVEKLSYSYNTTVLRPAVQVMNKFGNQLKISKFFSTFGLAAPQGSIDSVVQGSLEANFNIRKPNLSSDLQKTPFGRIHNAATINGHLVLRPLFQIIKPTPTSGKVLPNWLSTLVKTQPYLWEPAPLAKDTISGETSFETLLKDFATKMLNNIQSYDNFQSNQMSVSLASLRVRGVLALNPKAANNQRIYQFGNGYQAIETGPKNQNQVYIYKDYVTDKNWADGLIYDQSAVDYQTMQNYGFGSKVIGQISKNWQATPSNDQKPILNISSRDLKWPILNPGGSFAKKPKIFQARYENKTVVLSALDGQDDLFKQVLTTVGFKYGLNVLFEAKETNGKWTPINNEGNYTDQAVATKYDNNKKAFVLPATSQDWATIRIRLVPIDNKSDSNRFINWNSYSEDENKFTSAEHSINDKPIIIDKNWFNNTNLSTQTQQNLDQISVATFDSYEKSLKDEFKKANSNNTDQLWNQIELVYSFAGSEYVDKTQIVTLIKQGINDSSRSDRGWFSLWNGTVADTKGKAILKAKFKFRQSITNGSFANPNGIFITNDQELGGSVKSDIKSKYDLKEYFATLLANPLVVTTEKNLIKNGDIRFPAPTSGRFNGLNQQQMSSFLNSSGLKFQYLSWNRSNNTWNTNWSDSLSQITTYNESDPSFKIRVVNRDSNVFTNIQPYNGSELMSETYGGVEIKLQIPKVVKVNSDFRQKLLELVNQQNPFGGNTKNITINNIKLFEESLLDLIKKQSTIDIGKYQSLNSFLKIKYQVGNQNWKSVDELKEYLINQPDDLENNKIEVQFVLEKMDLNNPQYVLDQSLENVTFEILQNGNTTVKLYVHGNSWRAQLNKVSAFGNRNHLSYDWSKAKDLEILKANNSKGVKLEWRLKNQSNDQWKDLSTDGLPTDLVQSPDIQALELRLRDINPNDQYFFEQNNELGEIDLRELNALIKINPQWFNNTQFSSNIIDLSQIDVSALNDYEKQIQGQILNPLSENVKLQFALLTPGVKQIKQWLNPSDFVNELNRAATAWNDQITNGIISLSNGDALSNIHSKIYAKFVVAPDSKITLVDENETVLNDESQLSSWIDTSSIKTTLDLSAYVTQLTTLKATVISSNATTGLIDRLILPNNGAGNYLFRLKSFAEIKGILEKFEIKIVISNQNQPSEDDWFDVDDLSSYDPKLRSLKLAFINNGDDVRLRLTDQLILDSNQNSKQKPTVINLNVPKVLDLEAAWFGDFQKQKGGFTGNTKQLGINESLIADLINNLQVKLGAVNGDFKNAPLTIKFKLSDQGSFVSAAELKANLAKVSDQDQQTRVIKMQVQLTPEADANEWILQGYTTTTDGVNVFEDQDSPLKIFLHDQGIYDALNNVELSGDNQNLQWNFKNITVNPNSGLITNPNKQGQLVVEYNFDPNLSSNKWTVVQPKAIPTNLKNAKIRLNWWNGAEQKYTLEGINGQNLDSLILKEITLDLSKIKKILMLQSQWLDLIGANGDLINLTLDEQKFADQIRTILPSDEADNIIPFYSIDGLTWRPKLDFIKFLQQNNGQESNSNFILKRQNVQVRFGMKENIDPQMYAWNIDGNLINNLNDFYAHKTQLIDDVRNRNDKVKGVINIDDLVSGFKSSNFTIIGSNLVPQLSINDENTLNAKFAPYASDRLFKIELTTTKTSGKWDWSSAKVIWTNGIFNKTLDGLQITNNSQVAIRFVVCDPDTGQVATSANSKYYLKNKELEKVLDISGQVRIVTAIINPFEQASKKLAIKVRGENNKAKWQQGHGQFKIMVGDTNYQPSDQLASEFLKASKLPPDQQEALEFVYQIFKSKPDQTVITNQSDPDVINDPNSNWKSFPASEWSGDLGLNVGDYVMVALRIKPNYQNGANKYILANDQHSVLIPIKSNANSNDSITQREPGRISGLLVDPNVAKIANFTLASSSPDYPNQLLDGWAQLNNVQISQEQNHYLGIELKIELFSEFHLDKSSDKVLVSASKSRLVKRQKDGMTQGSAYKDAQGVDIIDKEGNTVYLYTDPRNNNHPAPPTEATTSTRSAVLSLDRQGEFKLNISDSDRDVWSLFKNQRVQITYQANKGLGTDTLPDFELTSAKSVDLKEPISQRIKFGLENPQNVVYSWANPEDFSEDAIQFESSDSSETKPTNGASRVKTVLKLKRQSKTNTGAPTEITGNTGFEAITKIEQQIQTDFGNQLQFSYQQARKDGQVNTYQNSANFYHLSNLKNGDTIKLSLKAADPDLVFLDAPQDLVFTVNGLIVEAPARDALQYLRVEQGGKINGQGTFRVLVHNPSDPYQDPDKILRGWKFLIRVWNQDRTIKFNWTDDQTKITGLSNGDKVEWKLVDENNNPVRDAYYNTVAGKHRLEADGNVSLQFEQVNYANGPEDKTVVQVGIGDYPDKANENQYPTTSGFVIGGLQERLLRFDLSQLAFEKILNTLRPHYKGFDGHGILNFDDKFMEGTWWINHQGEVYQGNPETLAPSEWATQPEAITLEQFFAHTTFYTANPATTPGQLGWQFTSNATAVDNRLWNGNQLWARFDVAQSDQSAIIARESNQPFADAQAFLIAALPDVGNLSKVPDPMSPLWWVLAAFGSVLTLGGLAIFLWKQRNKKIKDPKF